MGEAKNIYFTCLKSEWYGGRKLDCVDNSLNKAELEDGEFDGTI